MANQLTIKKIDFSNIPKDYHYKHPRIKWSESIGKNISFTYNDINGIFKIVNFEKSNNKVTIEYNNNLFSIHSTNLVKCKIGTIIGKINYNYRYKIGENIKDNKRNITITNQFVKHRINKSGGKYIPVNEKCYNYICNNCGHKNGEIIQNNILKGHGCACCHGTIVVEGINDIPTTAPWMIPYFQGGYDEAKLYTKESGKKIYFICPNCKQIKDRRMAISTLYSTKSLSCICSDVIPYPEKLMFSILKQLNIEFKTQLSRATLKWCKGNTYDVRYDFYIPSLNCIIETHGNQHYNVPHKKSMFKRTLKEEQENDIFKEQLARNNGIENYIVIDCRKSELEWIKNSILNSELPNILNFKEEDINWNKCEEFVAKNFYKIICNYRNNNSKMLLKDIQVNLNISRWTLDKALSVGKNVGWLNLNKKEVRDN